MDQRLRTVIRSQYRAALKMLEETVSACPADLWIDTRHTNTFWRVAYHVLFYTHLYLQEREEDFTLWSGARDQGQHLSGLPGSPHDEPHVGEPLSPAEIKGYIDFCRAQVDEHVATMDFLADSGFGWLPFDKLELQFYIIRHLMQHTGELMERIASEAPAELPWVGMDPGN